MYQFPVEAPYGTNPRQVAPLPDLFSPGPETAAADYAPGSPSKLPRKKENLYEMDSSESDFGSDASESSTDPDPMPEIPRRVTVQLRNVFEIYRKKFKQNPLTLRFRDPMVEADFESSMNADTAFVNSLLMFLGSIQMVFLLTYGHFTWGPTSTKFRTVMPFQVSMLFYSLGWGVAMYLVPWLRERQRLIWSVLYGILVFILFVVMDTAERAGWEPTPEAPVDVFVSGNLIVLLFVYTSTLQIPTLNAAIAVIFLLSSHVSTKSGLGCGRCSFVAFQSDTRPSFRSPDVKVISYAIFVPQSLTRGYIPSITVYFTSSLVGLGGGWLRERNARERVLMERFTRTKVVASLAEGLQAMRSMGSRMDVAGDSWAARAVAWVRRGSRRVHPSGEHVPVTLFGSPWLFFRSRILLIFRDPFFEQAFETYYNNHHALFIFRIQMTFLAISTAIHAVLDYTTYHEFLISEMEFKLWLAITAVVCISGFFLSFSSVVRRHPVVFQAICWLANMAVLQVVLVLYTINRNAYERNIYAPIAVEIILASAGESGMRIPWFLFFAGVILTVTSGKVIAGVTGIRELLDVSFPIVVGIVYGRLAEGEIRRWYVVRQRAVSTTRSGEIFEDQQLMKCSLPEQLIKVPGINRINGQVASSWDL
jgi:hypothetical protein